MILSASYEEITRLVREKSGQQIGLQYKDADTLTLSYEASIPIPIISKPLTHKVSADVTDMASQKLLEKLPAGLVESFSGGRIVLNLDAVPQLKALFARLQVNSLTFYGSSLSLDASLK